MNLSPSHIGLIHFVGIGGIGMSGIATVLQSLHFQVQGSDLSNSPNVERLRAQGIPVAIGHRAENVQNASVLVVSSAITPDNPEWLQAQLMNIPIIGRAEMLAELMRLHTSIAVSGTHGKTTSTSLIGALLDQANFDPTIINGGIINAYGSNARLGQGEWIVVEADESDGSFTKLTPTIAVITNIDPEHMEFHKDNTRLEAAFHQFMTQVPFYGLNILCSDHPRLRSLSQTIHNRRIVTYGLDDSADICAKNIIFQDQGMIFDVLFQGNGAYKGQKWSNLKLALVGVHNVQNALITLAIAQELSITEEVVRKSLENFLGVKRRFSLTGYAQGAQVIDDYAHHPVEITAVLNTAKQICKGKIFLVCQPHRYSRVSYLFNDFVSCLQDVETLFLLPIYSAGEAPLPDITSEKLGNAVKKPGHSVSVVENFEDVACALKPLLKPQDMVLCVGAGSITQLAHALPQMLGTVECAP